MLIFGKAGTLCPSSIPCTEHLLTYLVLLYVSPPKNLLINLQIVTTCIHNEEIEALRPMGLNQPSHCREEAENFLAHVCLLLKPLGYTVFYKGVSCFAVV